MTTYLPDIQARAEQWITDNTIKSFVPVTDIMVWVDIETTGLDENKEEILEIGVMLTDSRGFRLFHVNYTLSHPGKIQNDFVRNMHERSGLAQECADLENWRNCYNASINLSAFLHSWSATRLPMAGSSVHFDRTFLKKHLPDFEALFHYRNIDISTLKGVFDLRGADVPKPWQEMKAHRAIPDLIDSIEEYRAYLRLMALD